MDIKITKENFLKASMLAEKLTGKNLNLPILNSLLISAQKGKIKITATNLDASLEIFTVAKVDQEGVIAVPAKVINSIVSSLKDDVISISYNNVNLKITAKNSNASIKVNNPEDFPILPKFKKEGGFKIEAEHLLNGLKAVCFSASVSYFKPEIASVYFYSTSDYVFFAATDSFRLAEKNFSNDIQEKNIFSILIPLKNAIELIRILEEVSKQESQISVEFNKNEFMVYNSSFSFFSRLTEGMFPDYKQFIPKSYLGEIIIDSVELMDVLRSSQIFLSRLNDIVLEIYPKEEVLLFKTSNPDLGEYNAEIKISKNGFSDFKEEKINLAFNLKYLIEGVSRIESSKTIFKISEDGKPMVIGGEEDKSMLYLIMPMKL